MLCIDVMLCIDILSFFICVCRHSDSAFMAQSSLDFLEKLKELITARGFQAVPSTMYVPHTVLRDFAQANSSLQFLVMKECDGKIMCILSVMLVCLPVFAYTRSHD
jgi:hypothetical protein